jgi:hypothetical protein
MRRFITAVLFLSLALPALAAPKKFPLSDHQLVGKWTKRSLGDVDLGVFTFFPDGNFRFETIQGIWRSTGPQWIELRFTKTNEVAKWHWDQGIHSGEQSVTVFDARDVKQDDFQLIPVVSPGKSVPGVANPFSAIVGKWDKGPVPITLERSGKFIFGTGRDVSIGVWKTTGVNCIVYQFKGKQVTANWKIIENGHRLVMSLTIPNEKPMTANFWR